MKFFISAFLCLMSSSLILWMHLVNIIDAFSDSLLSAFSLTLTPNSAIILPSNYSMTNFLVNVFSISCLRYDKTFQMVLSSYLLYLRLLLDHLSSHIPIFRFHVIVTIDSLILAWFILVILIQHRFSIARLMPSLSLIFNCY